MSPDWAPSRRGRGRAGAASAPGAKLRRAEVAMTEEMKWTMVAELDW
jgi:hypothetical protein